MPESNIIAVTFDDRSNAFQALSELKGAGMEGRVDVAAAAVVTRDADGRISMPDGVDNNGAVGTWGGSLVGLLIGVIGGPIGMLLGWTGGLLVGGAFDLRRVDRSAGALEQISSAIPIGGTALVAEVTEYAREVVDGEMAKLDGVVIRRPREEVLDEMEAAEEAYREAETEARRHAREQRKAERKAEEGCRCRSAGSPSPRVRRAGRAEVGSSVRRWAWHPSASRPAPGDCAQCAVVGSGRDGAMPPGISPISPSVNDAAFAGTLSARVLISH